MAHTLYDTDRDARRNVVKLYLRWVHAREIKRTLVLVSDEAFLRLSRYVKSQNDRYRSAYRYMLIHGVAYTMSRLVCSVL
jgi:hypothetical protein